MWCVSKNMENIMFLCEINLMFSFYGCCFVFFLKFLTYSSETHCTKLTDEIVFSRIEV